MTKQIKIMRYYGHIIRWNSSRGFGAIREEHTGNEIFAVHSAFDDEPQDILEGQKVSFSINSGRRGRREALEIRFTEDDWAENFLPPETSRRPSPAGNIIMWLIALTALAGMAFAGFHYYRTHHQAQTNTTDAQTMVDEVAREMKAARRAWKEAAANKIPLQATAFHCDGRQYCSQMTSREEAEFFITHCADTKMDSDHDGEPCEHDSRW